MWLPILTAVLGASLGAILAYVLSRPRPSVTLDAIQVTAKFPSDAAVRPDAVVEERAFNYWRPNPLNDVGGTPSEREYVEALQATQRMLEDDVDVQAPKLRTVAASIRAAITSQDYGEVETIWVANSHLIFEALAVEYMNGRLKEHPYYDGPLEPEMTLPKGRRLVYVLEEEREILHYITRLSIPYNIAFQLYLFTQALRVELRRLATGIATALADQDNTVLLSITDQLREIATEHERQGRELAGLVEAALNPYLRFVAKGVLTNSGRNSYSVQNRSKLFIRMGGYVAPNGTTLSDDVTLDMVVGVPNEELGVVSSDSPILVAAGVAKRFLAIAQASARNIPEKDAVLKAFEAGGQKAYLAVGVTGVGSGKTEPTWTPDVLFRSIEQSMALQAKRDKRRERSRPSR